PGPPTTVREPSLDQPRAQPGFAELRLRRLAMSSHPAPVVTPPVGFYQRGLEKAQAVMDQALADSTRDRQDAAAAELQSWLSGAGAGTTLLDASPEDLLVYLEEWWLPNHPGRKQEAAGPQAVKGVLSALSGWFSRAGRVGPFDPVSRTGNPCECPWVSDYRKGYTRLQMVGGYEEVSAVPMTEEKYGHLCQYLLDQAASATDVADTLTSLRDLLCVQFMFQSTYRGYDVGKLALGDFCHPDYPDRADWRLPLPPPQEWPPGATYRLCIRERGTKTSRIQRAPAVYLQSNPTCPARCFPRTLALYMWRARQPDADGFQVVDHLFRPLRPNRLAFKEEPLSSSALGARVRRHLHAAGLYEGETNHSFRRGALQAAAQQGLDESALKALGQIRSSAVLARYTDPTRHVGPQKKRQRSG
ncbi:hypothetical protein Vretimale_78, partial [Volvox reticuliferus]